jgi:mRNA deadenylase 3'-5' endonuclease subunit Ccr4
MMFGGPLRPLDALAPMLPTAILRGSQGFASFKLMSWNLLAPPYRRGEEREDEPAWKSRARLQIAQALAESPDVIGLQEFWSANAAFVNMWQTFAEEQGCAFRHLPTLDPELV